MAAHATHHRPEDDKTQLGDRARPLATIAMGAAVIGLLACFGLGFIADEDHSFRRCLHAYLAAYGFFLSLGLGSLFFVIVQHLTKAGWSVNVRRIPETLASTMPLLALLSIPLVLSVVMNNGVLYPWAQPLHVAEHHEETPAPAAEHAADKQAPAEAEGHAAAKTEEGKGEVEAAGAEEGHEGAAEHKHHFLEEVATKQKYLNVPFFLVRMAIYVGVWCVVGLYYYRNSVRQDADGDIERTNRMQLFSPISAILTMLTLTFAAVDLLMSLDPLWYSTIFGVYYFAGCAIGIFAFMSLTLHLLQANGYLKGSVTADHYHDLGKFLFGFVFFWGYIAFSQFMLLWYGNIPEEIGWWRLHGGTTVSADVTIWSYVLLALLFGKLLLPFGGLLSRHVKRNKAGLIFWSCWLLVFQALDIFWIVMPQLKGYFNTMTVVMYLAAFVGIGGVVLAAFLRTLGSNSLRPLRDPRLDESMAFTNI